PTHGVEVDPADVVEDRLACHLDVTPSRQCGLGVDEVPAQLARGQDDWLRQAQEPPLADDLDDLLATCVLRPRAHGAECRKATGSWRRISSPRAGAGADAGCRLTQNRLPPSAGASTHTCPPISDTSCRTPQSPIPAPAVPRAAAAR